MDAISFVLGIKSSHLRSTQLRDLVYRGRVLKHSKINADGTATDQPETNGQNGHVNGDLPSDEEEVSQPQSQRNDPQTAWVMAVYEDEAHDEQKWKRSITSTGQSEYRINNRVVTAKQYNDTLEEENILIKARNFLVFQGDVEAIASQSPKDLTRLVEQISGSLEYKEEYERLKVEFEKATEDHAFRLNQRRAMNSEIKQYQEQKKEAESFERKAAERDEAIVTHILWKLYHLQRQIEESGAEIQKHQDSLQAHRKEMQSYEEKYEEAKREQAKVTRECNKIERAIKQKEGEISSTASELVPIDEKLAISAKSQEKGHNRLDSVKKERENQSSTVERYRKDLASVEKAQKRWEDEWKQTARKQGKQLSDADLQEYSRLRGEVTKKTAADQMEVDKLDRQLKTDEETASSMKSTIDSSEARVQKLQDDAKDLGERKTDFSSRLNQTKKDLEAKSKALNQLTSERLRTAQKKTELEERLVEVAVKLADADTGQRESEKERRMRETVATLKRIYPGVKGRLHELCKPKQKKYETAVGVVLGRHYDSIVVDTEATARDCIVYLRDQRLGQATFIPLDTIQVKQINPNLKTLHRGARLALDTVEFDSQYERAMAYACGTALVCDDQKIAKIVCFEKGADSTAVALDGTKISKGGLMTGGRGAQEKPRRWDDAEVEKLRTLKDKLLSDIQQLNASANNRRGSEEESLQSEKSGLEERAKLLEQELSSINRNIQDKKKELDFAKSQVKEASPRYNQQISRVNTLKSKLQSHQNEINKAEDKIFTSFCKKHDYKDIREYEAQQGSLQQEALDRKLHFSEQKNKLVNQISFETNRLEETKNRVKRLEDQLKQDSRLITALTSEKETIEQDLDRLRDELSVLADQLETSREKESSRAEKVLEAKKVLQKRSKAVEETLKQIQEIETEVQRNNASRYALLRKCRIEEIKIPLSEESQPLSALPLNGMQETDPDAMDVDEDEQTLQVEEIQDYGIDLDFDNLDDDLKEDDSPKQEDALKQTIDGLNTELDKMAPNMRATDRLESVESRLRSTEKDLEAARRTAKKAKDDFEEAKEKRLELFNKAFNHISEQIGPVYRDLTQNAQTPMGGQAYVL
jgi:structural maintenance of chromosome 1